MILIQSFVLFLKLHPSALFCPGPSSSDVSTVLCRQGSGASIQVRALSITQLSLQGSGGLWGPVYSLKHGIMRIKQLLEGGLGLKEIGHERA